MKLPLKTILKCQLMQNATAHLLASATLPAHVHTSSVLMADLFLSP